RKSRRTIGICASLSRQKHPGNPKPAVGAARGGIRRFYRTRKEVNIMSDIIMKTAVQEPAAASNGDTPTITHFQQLAANLKTAISAVMAEIPKFEIANGDKVRFVRAHQSVPPE